MRKYKEGTKELELVVCNCCGRRLRIASGILLEGVCPVEVDWGYHSGKDLEHHSFDLCEACYDKLTSGFVLAPEKTERTEF